MKMVTLKIDNIISMLKLFSLLVGIIIFFEPTIAIAIPNCENARKILQSRGIPDSDLPSCSGSILSSNGSKNNPYVTCSCEKNIKSCTFKLDGYGVSQVAPPNISPFAQILINEFRNSTNLVRLEYKGYADGTSDKNGAGTWNKIDSLRCRKNKSGVYYDVELAEIRRCIMREYIEFRAGVSSLIPIEETQFDYPSLPENKTDKFRKVEITIYRKESCK
jgi:hypothetical protein